VILLLASFRQVPTTTRLSNRAQLPQFPTMKLESNLPKQSPWLYTAPLLNTILLLLVYFLFTSDFVVQSGITVEPPQSNSRLTGF
jgi:hypothetical protein